MRKGLSHSVSQTSHAGRTIREIEQALIFQAILVQVLGVMAMGKTSMSKDTTAAAAGLRPWQKKKSWSTFSMICRSEGDAMGRITAGILGPLKFDKSLSQGTIEQLRNLGTGGMDDVFSTSRPSRQNSFGSVGTPRTPGTPVFHAVSNAASKEALEATIATLQSDILESKARCAYLTSVEDESRTEDIRQLTDKQENMQSLVTRMRALI